MAISLVAFVDFTRGYAGTRGDYRGAIIPIGMKIAAGFGDARLDVRDCWVSTV